MNDWKHGAADLFRAGRTARSAPTGVERERLRARLAAELGAATALGAGAMVASKAESAATVASTAARAVPSSVSWKAAALGTATKVTLAVIVLGGAVVAARGFRRDEAPARRPPEQSEVVVAPIPSAAPAEPLPTVSAWTAEEIPPRSTPIPRRTAPAPAVRVAPSTATTSTSMEEARLVSAIAAALRRGDGAAALALADEHRRTFPHGTLSEERDGAVVVARCLTGAGTASEAAAFLASHPRSPMRSRIVKTCDAGGTP